MKGKIQHFGTIQQISGMHIVVRILQASACSACSAASLCRSSETKEKEIDVYDANAASYHVGDRVKLEGSVGQGLHAALWGYAVPLILLVVVLMIGVQCTGSEGWAAVMSLGSLVPYYVILYLLRDRLQRSLSFRIVDTQEI